MRGKPKYINLSSLLQCQAFTSEFGSEAKPGKFNEVKDLKGNQTIENHLLTVFAQVDVPILNKAIYDSSGCEELSLKSWNKPIRFRPCPKLQEKHFVNQKMTESNNQKISCQSIFCWMYLHWSVWERRLFSSLWGHSHKQANLVASLLSCKIKSLPSGFCVHCYNFNKFFIWRWKVVPQLISIFRIVWQILGTETASFSAKQAIMNRDQWKGRVFAFYLKWK